MYTLRNANRIFFQICKRFSFEQSALKNNLQAICVLPKIENEDYRNKKASSAFYLGSSAFVGVSLIYALYKLRESLFPSVEASALNSRRKQFNFISDVVKESVAALVNIKVIDNRRIDFFTGQNITESNGSGFIVHENGLILTNAHVVMSKRANTKLKVKLYDGSVYDGVVEDVDMKSDLATVRINASKKLPTMKLGNSEDIEVGEWVIAMGSPLSLANTITTGVISTVHRTSQDLRLYGKDMQYLQTDAIITFGNSGGPLVNLDGEVIGINVMKVSTGISFAIPIEYAKDFLKANADNMEGISKGKKKNSPRRFIGITMLTLSPDLIRDLQEKKDAVPPGVTSGVLVWKVMIGSPAFSAGLQPGDVVTEVNGEKIVGASSVYKILESGGDLHITLFRRGRKLFVTLTPETYDN